MEKKAWRENETNVEDSGKRKEEDRPKEVKGDQIYVSWEDLLGEDMDEEVQEKIGQNTLLWVEVMIGGRIPVSAVIDTGATHPCIDKECYDQLVDMKVLEGELPVSKFKISLTVGHKKINISKQILVEFTWQKDRFWVVLLVVAHLFSTMVLGMDWLKQNRMVINCAGNRIYKEEKEEDKETSGRRITKGKIEGRKDCGNQLTVLKLNFYEKEVIGQLSMRQRLNNRWGKIWKEMNVVGELEVIEEEDKGMKDGHINHGDVTRINSDRGKKEECKSRMSLMEYRSATREKKGI